MRLARSFFRRLWSRRFVLALIAFIVCCVFAYPADAYRSEVVDAHAKCEQDLAEPGAYGPNVGQPVSCLTAGYAATNPTPSVDNLVVKAAVQGRLVLAVYLMVAIINFSRQKAKKPYAKLLLYIMIVGAIVISVIAYNYTQLIMINMYR